MSSTAHQEDVLKDPRLQPMLPKGGLDQQQQQNQRGKTAKVGRSRQCSRQSNGNVELTPPKRKASHEQQREQEQLQQQQEKQQEKLFENGDHLVDLENERLVKDDKVVEGGNSRPSSSRSCCCSPVDVLLGSPFISWMLVFAPLGIVSGVVGWREPVTFSLNFLAIVPLAWLIGKSTDDLSSHLGQILGGLLNAWFGNVVEMLLCICAIRANELLIVKTTLMGSILSNLLLVAGCSFLFGGFSHHEQKFSKLGASTNASLLIVAVLCLGLPTLYGTLNPQSVRSELHMSRAVSFLLIFMYIQYMVFQLRTHVHMFQHKEDDDEEEDEDSDGMTPAWATIVLGISTVCCAANGEYLIRAIAGTVESWNISKSFIGIILLPIIGNAAEHYTSVIAAMKNKMDLSIGCAIGSSCQMALFVTPMTVLAGWFFGVPMSLDLHVFEMVALLLSVLVVSSILQDGASNWLEGSMLVSAYLVIAFMYFFEDPAEETKLPQ